MSQPARRVYHSFAEFERSEHHGVGAAATMTSLTPLAMSIDQMLERAFPAAAEPAVEAAASAPAVDTLPDNLIELFEIRGPVRFG